MHSKLFTLLSDDDARKQYILPTLWIFLFSCFCIFAAKRWDILEVWIFYGWHWHPQKVSMINHKFWTQKINLNHNSHLRKWYLEIFLIVPVSLNLRIAQHVDIVLIFLVCTWLGEQIVIFLCLLCTKKLAPVGNFSALLYFWYLDTSFSPESGATLSCVTLWRIVNLKQRRDQVSQRSGGGGDPLSRQTSAAGES